MIIDTHIHEKKYSPDSEFSLEEAVSVAKKNWTRWDMYNKPRQ